MATLTGNLKDVTTQAPSTVSSITVKAPGVRLGVGNELIVSSPAEVNFNHDTGVLTLTDITGGLSWLIIEGTGWSDTVALSVADGMTTLVEAVANALGVPGMVDYVRLMAALSGAIDDVAQDAVDAAADNIKWTKRGLETGEDLDTVVGPGLYTVLNYTRALSLVNRPEVSNAIDRSAVEVLPSGGGAVQQTWYPMGVASRTDMPVMRRRRDTAGEWTEWERINAFTPAKETYIMQSISAAKWEQRALVRDEDMDDLTTAGMYYVPSYTVANSLVNNPVELSRSAIDRAKIEVAVTGGYISQIWTTLPAATKEAESVERHRDSTGEWSEWAVYGGGSREDDTSTDTFETLGLMSNGMQGEHVGTRSLLGELSGEESPVWSWWAPTPTQALDMPTHDGGGQTCHPSVLYFPNTWGGWKYWMAHTPYPNFKEAHEDPNIAVSDDGVNWQVPNGVTNPLDDGLGRPNYHNSDTHLAMWGNTMVLTWRTVDRPNGGQNIIYARTSQNGVTWTPKVEMLKIPLGAAESTFVSQSLVKMPTGWRLYGIRSNYGPNRLGYYETSVETLPKTSDWGSAKDCDLGTIPAGRDPWHSEVQRLAANDWVAIISDGNRGSTGVDGDIYLARSTDGVKWDVSPMPLTPRNNGVINSLYKTGFVVSGTGTNRTFDLWVSGYRTDKRTWGIYRTLAEYRGSNQAEALPITRVGVGSPEGKVEAPVGSIYTDSAATNGAIRWIKTSGTGATGWSVEYGDTGWRDITSSTVNRSSPAVFADGAGIQIRRFQGTVQYRFFGDITVTSQFGKLTDNFTGFRPKWDGQMELISRAADLKAGTWQVRLENGISGEKLCLAGESRLMMWDTEQPWPSTLPGTPA